MAWYNFKKEIANTSVYKPLLNAKNNLKETFKGLSVSEKIKFPQELGVEHPFDFLAVEEVYKKVPAVMGAIDKYIDFIVGPGFYVKSKNPKAQIIIEQFIQDFNFDSILRDWVKESLVKGNGYLELGLDKQGNIDGLKVLDAKYIYIDTDDKGIITAYNQYFKDLHKLDKKAVNPLPVENIAHISLNKIGDNPYGFGLVSSALITVNDLLQNQKDLHTLMNRKANSPMHVKVGDLDRNMLPTAEDIKVIGEKLEWMNNKHEWATDPTWDIKVVDFGDIGEKFSFVLDYDIKMLLYGLQVPEVLMGTGNIPEGLAKVQMDAWERNVQSKQAEIEKVIEDNIFKRILHSQNISDHVEFEWGQQSNDERATDIRLTTELLRIPIINFGLKHALEQHIAKLYSIDPSSLSSPEEEKADAEKQTAPPPTKDKKTGETLKEWLKFDYYECINDVINALKTDEFITLKANGLVETKAGKLSPIQVENLRLTLINAFKNNSLMEEIVEEVKNRVNLKELYRIKDGNILLGENGEQLVKSSVDERAKMIVETETIRIINKIGDNNGFSRSFNKC